MSGVTALNPRGDHSGASGTVAWADPKGELLCVILTTRPWRQDKGFVLRRILPHYLDEDEESRGHALLLEWINLHYSPHPAEKTRSTFPVRICTVQYRMRRIASFDAFAEQCEYFVDVASGYKSDFVVFPEIFTLQLLSFLPNERPGLAVRKYVMMRRGIIASDTLRRPGGPLSAVSVSHPCPLPSAFRT